MSRSDWSAIADGPLAERAAEAVAGITTDLSRLDPAATLVGKSDLALFFGYLARVSGSKVDESRASAWLDASVDEALAHPAALGLFGGLTGVAWASEHLGALFSDTDDGDPNADVDDVLVEFVSQRPWQHSYDLIGGLVGMGVYFLERFPRPVARQGLTQIVVTLGELAECDDTGVRWYTPVGQLPPWQQKLAPDGYYNLGMAHGMPGIVALLGHCVARRVAATESERLLEGAMRWLLSQQQHTAADSWFGAWTARGAPESSPSRLAWCYGDPGVAVAILSAGIAAGVAEWTQAGLDTVMSFMRRPIGEAGINDACLCHGSAGMAHIYNRLFHLTADERLRDAALLWYGHALDLRSTAGYGGYQSFFPSGYDGTPLDSPWRDDASLLSGSAGIGLALLAGTTSLAPDWDRLLMTAPVTPAAADVHV